MKATSKEKAQKMISAKIVAKLVELANKHVVPCIKIKAPGKYTAKEMANEVDSFGNKLYWGIDADKYVLPELEVTIGGSDFNEKELKELGYSPKFKLSIPNLMVFLAIAKYERLAGIRLADVAKFVVGEPATIYETERAKVMAFDYAKQKIVTKTKTLTIISDSLALYPLLKKDYSDYAVCALINGKWIEVHRTITCYDFNVTVEKVKKIVTHERLRSAVEKYIEEHTDAYADYCRLILSELEAMDKLNAETVGCTGKDSAKPNTDAPPKDSGTPTKGRKSKLGLLLR